MTGPAWFVLGGAVVSLLGMAALIAYFRRACREAERAVADEAEEYLRERASTS